MHNYFEADRVIVPYSKVARVSKALDKNGKVYSINVFLEGAESATFADAEATRFIIEFKRWLDHGRDDVMSMPLGEIAVIEE